jgi:penicillin-binding protein 1C
MAIVRSFRAARLPATAAVAALVGNIGIAGAVDAATTFEEVRRSHRSSEAVLLDRNGELLHELRVDDAVRRLSWVALPDVSPALVEAVVRAEDRRFFEHGGVDWRALGDAAIDTLLKGAPRGASTLSMQVAAMLEPTLRATGSHRTVTQKWDQIRAARALEARWSKREILEAYLNLSPFRGELTGLGAAARGLFDKAPSGLDARVAAILAALLRGPNAPPDVVARRACGVAAPARGVIECGPFEVLARAALGKAPRLEARVALAPHLARELLSRDASRVVTTLDRRLQSAVLEVLSRQIDELARRGVRDAAALVVDNATGDVLAYAGNQGAGASAPFVDGVRAQRQAGSTLKPFLYAQVIEERLLTPASLLDDSPADLVTPSGLYVPQNYDRDFRGAVSVRAALSGSLNVPAVRTLMLLGPERFTDRLREFGFEHVVPSGDFYGYSLALGSADVSLRELVNAYRALANGGQWSPLRVLPAPPGRARTVADAGAAWIVTDILSDRGARSASFGLENPLATPFWTAVKTGTSKDMRDNWCIGVSRRFTVGVWVGNFDGSPMRDVSGVSGAAPAWLAIMQRLHRNEATPAAPRPANVVLQRVRFSPPIEPERDEVFLRGTEVSEVVLAPSVGSGVRIAYPGDGAILAVDPDIPEVAQRVRFATTQALDGLQWRVNDTLLATDPSGGVLWKPSPGRFELVLSDAGGAVLDRVRFEVRGILR